MVEFRWAASRWGSVTRLADRGRFILQRIISRLISCVSMRSAFRDSSSRMWSSRDGCGTL
jgi:hypothetical protein